VVDFICKRVYNACIFTSKLKLKEDYNMNQTCFSQKLNLQEKIRQAVPKTIGIKILLILIACTFSISVNAIELKANYFVKNTGEIMNCKKIHFRSNDIKVVLENGEKLLISKDQIKALRANNKYYEKLPVYINNKKTKNEEFMQFITTRAGLKLYKYTLGINNSESSVGFNVNGYTTDCYVVFKGDQYYVAITAANYPTMFQFFGLPYSEK
jgi:hypothetical protein